MSRYLGNNRTQAIKVPCTPPAADDVLTVDPANPTQAKYQKAGTNNISDSAITTQKVADGAIANTKIGAGAVDDTKVAAGRTLIASGAVDASKNIDFNAASGWVNKSLDNLADGSSFKKVAGVDGSNKATGTSIAAGAISDSHVAAGAAITGSKLAAGTGALANLDNMGKLDFAATHTNKHLGNIADDPGGTWVRVAGVDATHKATGTSIATGAVTDAHVAAGAAIAGSKMSSSFALPGALSVAGATTLQGVTTAQEAVLVGVANADGQPYVLTADRATTNYCTNPSFETDTNGWEEYSPTSDAPTLSRVSSPAGLFGSYCLKIDSADTTPLDQIGAQTTVAASPSAANGEIWIASAWVKVGTGTQYCSIRAYGADATGASTGGSVNTFTALVGTDWVRLSVVATMADAAVAMLRCWVVAETPTGTFDLYVDGVLLEKVTSSAANPSSYFDGDTSGAAWTGTAHASTSTRGGGVIQHGASAPDGDSLTLFDDGELEVGQIVPVDGKASRIGLRGYPLQLAGGGTVFPNEPNSGDVFFRPDLYALYFYDGTGWIPLGGPPVGSITAFTSHIAGTPSLPANYHACDGTAISDVRSPMNGQSLPNLNGNNAFIRGNASSSNTINSPTVIQHYHNASGLLGGVTGTLSHSHQHNISTSGTSGGTYTAVSAVGRLLAGSGNNLTSTPDSSTIAGITSGPSGSSHTNRNDPHNMNVIFVMRIW